MLGPFPMLDWRNTMGIEGKFAHLQTGKTYHVIKSFTDYDGFVHPVGEQWVFLWHSFLPYEDGLTLAISLDGQQECHIRMQWLPEAQSEILDNLGDYIAAAT